MIPFFRFCLLLRSFLSPSFCSGSRLCDVRFLTKQLFYAPRWLFIISYPARPRRIIVKYIMKNQKIISLSCAVKILFLSFTCEDIGVIMVTNMISQLQESFPA